MPESAMSKSPFTPPLNIKGNGSPIISIIQNHGNHSSNMSKTPFSSPLNIRGRAGQSYPSFKIMAITVQTCLNPLSLPP